MPKRKKMHKRIGTVGGKGSAYTLCDRWVWGRTTENDDEVTCKNCLRKMPKEKEPCPTA